MTDPFEKRLRQWTYMMKAEGLTPRTVSFYRETMHAVGAILMDEGLPYMPRAVGPEHAAAFLSAMAGRDLAVQTRKGYYSALRKWCKDGGNQKVGEWPRPRLPADTRPRVDWLTADQARTLLGADMTALQRLVVVLELMEGLRHVEVIRLRRQDVVWEDSALQIRGKGPIGGKPRVMPLRPEAVDALMEWLAVRDRWAEEGAARYPKTWSDPDQVVVWRRAGRLYPYSEEGYGLDKMVVIPLSKAVGFHFSNHTLRRTFGRTLYRAGVPVATIAKMLGHESTEVTLRYIGVDMDDMERAMGMISWRRGRRSWRRSATAWPPWRRYTAAWARPRRASVRSSARRHTG